MAPPLQPPHELRPFLILVAALCAACGGRSSLFDAGTPSVSDWIDLPPGAFNQSLPYEDRCRTDRPVATRRVTLTRGFAILKREVTQREFSSVTGYHPRCTQAEQEHCGDSYPVLNVTWSDAAHYCNLLSRQAGAAECYDCSVSPWNQISTASCSTKSAYSGAAIYDCPGFRLPTDAEWEYAYRAGSQTELYNGELTSCTAPNPTADAIAWYEANSEARPHPVKQKTPNAWGLFDMAGNAAEFVHDRLPLSAPNMKPDPVTDPVNETDCTGFCLHVVRGGAFNTPAPMVQASARQAGYASDVSFFPSHGFRPARTSFE